MTDFTTKSSISFGVAGALIGAVMWLSETHSDVRAVQKDVREITVIRRDIVKIDERLSKIEGQLDIIIKQILKEKK